MVEQVGWDTGICKWVWNSGRANGGGIVVEQVGWDSGRASGGGIVVEQVGVE